MHAKGDLGANSLCIKAPVQGGISVASGYRIPTFSAAVFGVAQWNPDPVDIVV